MNLSDMGADVLRIVSATYPDSLEVSPPSLPGKGFSAAAAQVNRNKRTLTLNLKNAKAVKIVHELVKEYDIVLEQFRPGVMRRLKLDYDELSEVNPTLIYCSLTGYGQLTSMSSKAGHDINFMALSGIMGYSGRKDRGPNLLGIPISDIVGSYNAIIAMLAAVIYRQRTGKGQYLDISMLDSTIACTVMSSPGYLAAGASPGRESLWLNGSTLNDFYETKDGEYISVGGSEPKFWQAFCTAIGREDWRDKGLEHSELKGELGSIIKAKTREEWVAVFCDIDACVEPVLSLAEALDSQIVQERDMAVDVPSADGARIKQLGSPFKFSESPVAIRHAGKTIAESDTVEVLSELGYSEPEIAELIAQGVLK